MPSGSTQLNICGPTFVSACRHYLRPDPCGRGAGILDSGFAGVEMSDTMRSRLEESDYIFSGLKTFHELNEAFPSLLDEDGTKKPFERFLNDVQKVDET